LLDSLLQEIINFRNMYKQAILLIFTTLSFAMSNDEEGSNWSTLSFLTGSETQDDLDMQESQQISQEIAQGYEPESREQRYRRRRYRPRKRPSAYFDYDQAKLEENSYFDRDGKPAKDGLELDSSSSYSYDAPSYNAPTYDSPSYEAPSYNAPSYAGSSKDSFNDFLNALAAFLPIGLFLAAIPPNLIVINEVRKKRNSEDTNQVEYTFPFLQKISKLGFSKLQNQGCQKRLICEMAASGAKNNANFIQRLLAKISVYTPLSLAEYMNSKDVVQAVNRGNCAELQCIGF